MGVGCVEGGGQSEWTWGVWKEGAKVSGRGVCGRRGPK